MQNSSAQPARSQSAMVMRRLFVPVFALARARGRLSQIYLNLYLAVQQRTGNTNKINVLLAGLSLSEARFVLKKMGADVAETAYIDTHLLIHNPPGSYSNLRVREGAYIGKDCFIDLSDVVEVGPNVTLAPRVTVLTHFDAGNSFARQRYPAYTRPVLLQAGSYVGAGAMLLPGVVVGEGSLVAAGAVVHRDVPAYKVVGGIPAREISDLGQTS